MEMARTDLALKRSVDTEAILELLEQVAEDNDDLRTTEAERVAELETALAAQGRALRALDKIAGGTRYDGWNHINMGRRELMRVAAQALKEIEEIACR
jgi:hypothetical protein